MTDRWTGRVAVITGAGSGLGRGIAESAAERGMRVAVVDIDEEAANLVAARLRAGGADAWAELVDVRDAGQVEDLAERVYARGGVALLVNNAGIEQLGYLWDTPEQSWTRVMEVNVGGVFHGIKAFVPRMIAAGTEASVWNVSSVGAMTTIARQATYLTSKHAVLGLTEALAADIADVSAPVHVRVVLPAAVTSRIFESAGMPGSDASPAARAAAEAARSDMITHLATGIDPRRAAAEIFAQADRDEFYLLPQPGYVSQVMARRGEQLARRQAPPAGRPVPR